MIDPADMHDTELIAEYQGWFQFSMLTRIAQTEVSNKETVERIGAVDDEFRKRMNESKHTLRLRETRLSKGIRSSRDEDLSRLPNLHPRKDS